MATPALPTEECYSDEDDDFFGNFGNPDFPGNDEETEEDLEGMSGWQLAARGIQMAINNRVEEAQDLLRVDSSCIHRQAGFCYLTFIVSTFYACVLLYGFSRNIFLKL